MSEFSEARGIESPGDTNVCESPVWVLKQTWELWKSSWSSGPLSDLTGSMTLGSWSSCFCHLKTQVCVARPRLNLNILILIFES